MARTLTSANSIMTLSAPDALPGPQIIEGFATEDAFSVPQYETARAVKGVDGKMSAGFIPANKELDVVLQGDSISRPIFQQLLAVMESRREIVFVDITIVIPSVSEVWQCTKGVLTNPSKLPGAKKMLEQVSYKFTFDDIQPAGL